MSNIPITVCVLLLALELSAQDPNLCPTIPVGINVVDITTTFEPPVLIQADCDDDGVPDELEIFPYEDTDGDGILNICDPDSDNDGIGDAEDHCPIAVGPPENNGCPGTPEERRIFWGHGFQGNHTAWSVSGVHAEDTWELVSSFVDYKSAQESLSTSADRFEDVVDGIAGLQDFPERNIAFVHSLGGLVIREMGVPIVQGDKPALGGMVTLATPHLGAGPANVYVNDRVLLDDILSKACFKLTRPLVEEALLTHPLSGTGTQTGASPGSAFVLNSLILFKVPDIALEIACDPVLPAVVTGALSFISADGLVEEITTDAVSTLPPLAADHRGIAYGIEDNDLMGTRAARMLGSLLEDANTFDLFEANISDDAGIAFMNSSITNFANKVTQHNEASHCECFPPCGCFLYRIASRKVSDLFWEGLVFLRDYNEYWHLIIEGGSYVSTPSGCNCDYFVGYGSEYVGSGHVSYSGDCSDLNDPNTDCYQYFDVSFEFDDNDGFITAESASDMAASGANYQPYYLPGSNHMQMRNDPNTDALFQHMLDGGWDGGGFFKTDQR